VESPFREDELVPELEGIGMEEAFKSEEEQAELATQAGE
jgi:hypothetical protein